MELLLPVSDSGPEARELSSLRGLHESRHFLIFDENLPIYLHYDPQSYEWRGLVIRINETVMFEGRDRSIWRVCGEDNVWKLDPEIVRERLFHSNVVMNNGNRNRITLHVLYTEKGMGATIVPGQEKTLPCFEALAEQELKAMVVDSAPEKEASLSYPIYSLLNVRLRNFTLPTKSIVLSSLDFQASKSFCELVRDPQISISFIKYELVDGVSAVSLAPMCSTKFPLVMSQYDSFSIIYRLVENKQRSQRIRITIEYQLTSDAHVYPVVTSWDTEVSSRRMGAGTAVYQPPSQSNTTYTTPYAASVPFFGNVLTSSANHLESTVSLHQQIQPKFNANVSFTFFEPAVLVSVGRKFTLRLLVSNSSQCAINLVVYYSSIRAKETHDMRRRRQYEGIVLLSNDYKVPIIYPGETYELELHCIAFIPGYYHHLRGLKVVDLDTKAVQEIGHSISILAS
ncbi:AGR310Cp [Eremothecium gossypii ATCC 10895]|uniref:AGR310Cp n=1 Tax=Eremothecium gossypii (strain ATCC 10895 / CBS 109.51 / FGSC 9923 / NRRL Y-1056) TaxID=284811 RepID=Q74Z93_EREGS|nr:AGR310Cp [Eremothecium gossypii ATCC 10895]AAS54800.1 AGR310Cp [Eremothecium gossypii ATCC 10895]